MVLFDIVDDGDWDEIAHAHFTPQEQPDLGAANVILNELLNDVDVVLPGLQTGECLIDVGAATLHDE